MAQIKINENLVKKARDYAQKIAGDVQNFINQHTTSAVERTVCRILGLDGVNEVGIPLANVVVNHLIQKAVLDDGVLHYFANALIATGLSVEEIAKQIALGEIDLTSFHDYPLEQKRNVLQPIIKTQLNKIINNKMKREELINKYPKNKSPELYVIVATGNIYEDVIQAKAAAQNGADIIAIIRSTGQSLLDYVPYGPTTEGFGGTFATQANFQIMRKALDEVGEVEGRYIKLVNYASGLCMPEIAIMGAFERLDVMLNDSLYGILFRDINMKRTFVDQYFSRIIDSYAGIIINTGEDNYLTTADAIEEAHTVLASQFINEQFALKAYLPEHLQGLGHAFEVDPSIENGFLYELASAQLSRQIFPKAPLKYMPPTKFMTGNIFRGHAQNALFNVSSIMTKQSIHLLGMMSEAIHTPYMAERTLAIENAKYVFTTMANIADEIEFKAGGFIERRANEVLEKATTLLAKISKNGLFKALSEGVFANIKRPIDGGRGLEHVYQKSNKYFNLPQELMIAKLKERKYE